MLALQPCLGSLLLSSALASHPAAFVRPQALFVKMPREPGLQITPAAPAEIGLFRIFFDGRGRRDFWRADPNSGWMVDQLLRESHDRDLVWGRS
jgi:hypothetical protein